MKTEREQRLAKLFARTHAGIKPGLELMRELLEALGNPHTKFLSVHVAGTNGKGSTCAMIESGLRARGVTSGLYTSPHLFRVNERIRINGEELANEAFFEVLDQVQAVEDSLSRYPTFFETLTAMSFLAFAEAGVQVAVLETGMGGRLDCTNVVEPLLSVITRVDFDHMGFLGNTLEQIAGEKAGIIKSGRPLVIGSQQQGVDPVLTERAEELGCLWRRAEERVTISGRKQGVEGQRITLSGDRAEYGRIRFPLLGKFQLENLCTAVSALEWVEDLLGLEADVKRMKQGLEQVQWTGRCQVLSVDPPLLLDVAHNPGGAEALRNSLQELFGKRAQGVLFWAGLADKNPAGFLKTLRPMISSCVCMELMSDRTLTSESLRSLAEKEGLSCQILTVNEAKQQAYSLIREADFGCVAGSVYLAGEWGGKGTVDMGERL